jgi:hypothetical protein
MEGAEDNLQNLLNARKNKLFTPQDFAYNPAAVALKYNCTVLEAQLIIEKNKRNKATTRANFISKYGNEIGEMKFEEFRNKSKKSSDKINSLPKDERAFYYRSNSIRCWEYYIKRGLAKTKKEAEYLAVQFQIKNSGTNKAFYLSKGYTADEIDEILSVINAKKAFGYKESKNVLKDGWEEYWEKRNEKYRETLGCMPRSKLPKYKAYCLEVDKYTKLAIKLNGHKICDLDKRSRDFHLDHKFSKIQGFLCDIDARIIGHWTNLQIVESSINCSKRGLSSITIEELFEEYKKHES